MLKYVFANKSNMTYRVSDSYDALAGEGCRGKFRDEMSLYAETALLEHDGYKRCEPQKAETSLYIVRLTEEQKTALEAQGVEIKPIN